MNLNDALAALGIALGLGLLVGLQRERSDPAVAGVRTFPLITILGVVAAMLGTLGGGTAWSIGAGLLALAATTAMGNWLRPRTEESPGITTEVAILLMYAVGAMLWLAPQSREIPVAIGVACAILLHLKARLHHLVARMSDADLRCIMRFALVTFIILPVLPNRTFGPLDVLNPRQIWWMVVLVVGIGLAAYIVSKLVPRTAGLVVAGLLGGLISSTATTATAARTVRDQPVRAAGAAVVITIASAVVFIRLIVEVGVVAPGLLSRFAPPLAIMFLTAIAGAGILWLRGRPTDGHSPAEPNPSELWTAIKFALIYAAVLWLTALAQKHLGSAGIRTVAAISGLTDMDAITLSSARLARDGQIDAASGGEAIIIASIANLLFKVGLAGSLGGGVLLRKLLRPTAAVAAAGAALLLFWRWE